MPYGIPWDEAQPVGATTPAASVDTELQELKTSIRERMNDIVGAGNWEDDNVDPKVVGISVVMVAGAGLAFTVTGSQDPALTEQLNLGSYTVASTEITIDVGGTFLVWVEGLVNITNPTGFERITMFLQGTATIAFPTINVGVHETTISFIDSRSGFGYITANDGEDIRLTVQATNVTNQVNVTDTRLLLVRVA